MCVMPENRLPAEETLWRSQVSLSGSFFLENNDLTDSSHKYNRLYDQDWVSTAHVYTVCMPTTTKEKLGFTVYKCIKKVYIKKLSAIVFWMWYIDTRDVSMIPTRTNVMHSWGRSQNILATVVWD